MIAAWLTRTGGVLVAPRASSALGSEEEGRFDATIGVCLFVLGSQLVHLVEAAAAVQAMPNWSGVTVFASALARAILPPILALFLFDSLLGTSHVRLRGRLLAPLVACATAAHLLVNAGYVVPGPAWAPEVVGIVWGAALAFFLRRFLATGDEKSGES